MKLAAKLPELALSAIRRLNATTIGLALLALVAWPALAQAITVSVVPSDTTLVNGDTFTVRVATDGSTDLKAYHLIYDYDHTKLQLLSASVGELAAGHSPSAFLVPDVISSPPDSVIYDVALLGSSASGPGILAYFTFKALTTSTAVLTPLRVDFRNSLNVQTLPATSGATIHINDVLQVGLGAGGVTPVSCFGGSNGAIDITPTGGVGPYTYLWSPGGATSQDISGLTAGLYSVTVTDANNRTTSGSWTVTQPTALALSETHVNVLCFGNSTGSIDLSVSGGTAPYTYLWSPGGAMTQDLSSLAAGSYSVTVTDANGCSAVLGPISITQPAALALSETHVNVLCFGNSTGSIDLSVSGGTAPYTYAWSPGGATTQDLSGLAAGSYSVVVTDHNGCTAALGPISITQPAAPLALSETHVNVLCFGNSTGSIDLSVSGGTTPYSYVWSPGGATTQDLSGLAAGGYSVTVTDGNGCTALLGPITITQPSAVALSLTKTDATCNGASDGSITATFSGGTAPYQIKLGAGGSYAPATSPFTFSALAAGSYDVFVKDANGCETSQSITVNQASAMTLSLSKIDVTCNGAANGSVTATFSGGTPPYQIKLGVGGSYAAATSPHTFSALGPGSYDVFVKDANGCTTSSSITVSEPAVLTASETHTSTCLTSPDGSITLTVSGGTTPYTYLWSNGATTQNLSGLAAGNYSVTVTDAHGCIASVGPVAITVRTYTITPSAGVGGAISPATAQTVNCGANQSFTITPAACYTFTGLLVDGVGVTPVSPYTFTDVHADHTIAASFTAIALPLAVTSITATRTSSGNDLSGIAKIAIGYTAPGDGSTVEIWRKGFGNYPEYDDNPGAGSIPPMPSSYPPAGWTKTLVTASGQNDTPPARDFWYYIAYSVNACGQTTVSTVKTGGTLDYFLGDVHNGLADCSGDNRVTIADITFLGNNYGIHLSDPDALGCLDVGPTTTSWIDGRPLTDNQVEFEDLIMFAINYGTVSAPSLSAKSTPVASVLSLSVGTTAAVGETFDAVLNFKGGGEVQGLSAQLEFDPSVVEPVAVVGGSLLAQQAGPAQVFTPKPGTIDAAVFGNGLTLTGAGDLARVTFRVKSAGEPGITLSSVRARGARNEPVALMTPAPVESQPLPTRMVLAPSYPNPFNNAMTVVFGMPKAGPAKLGVFDIQGRAVRHLLDGTAKAGWTRTIWNGRGDDGLALAPGMYIIRLSADGRVTTKSVRLVR